MIRGRLFNKPKRSNKVLLQGNNFQTLEEAVRHYMSDGNINLPQAPEGSYEFAESAPTPDELRGAVDASFDRMDAAAMFGKQVPVQPSVVPPVDSSPTSDNAPAE